MHIRTQWLFFFFSRKNLRKGYWEDTRRITASAPMDPWRFFKWENGGRSTNLNGFIGKPIGKP